MGPEGRIVGTSSSPAFSRFVFGEGWWLSTILGFLAANLVEKPHKGCESWKMPDFVQIIYESTSWNTFDDIFGSWVGENEGDRHSWLHLLRIGMSICSFIISYIGWSNFCIWWLPIQLPSPSKSPPFYLIPHHHPSKVIFFQMKGHDSLILTLLNLQMVGTGVLFDDDINWRFERGLNQDLKRLRLQDSTSNNTYWWSRQGPPPCLSGKKRLQCRRCWGCVFELQAEKIPRKINSTPESILALQS